MVVKKLGQPVPLSYFISEVNSGQRAAGADEHAGALLVVERAGERALGAVLAHHVVGRRRQPLLPLGVRQREHFARRRHHRAGRQQRAPAGLHLRDGVGRGRRRGLRGTDAGHERRGPGRGEEGGEKVASVHEGRTCSRWIGGPLGPEVNAWSLPGAVPYPRPCLVVAGGRSLPPANGGHSGIGARDRPAGSPARRHCRTRASLPADATRARRGRRLDRTPGGRFPDRRRRRTLRRTTCRLPTPSASVASAAGTSAS